MRTPCNIVHTELFISEIRRTKGWVSQAHFTSRLIQEMAPPAMETQVTSTQLIIAIVREISTQQMAVQEPVEGFMNNDATQE